MPRSSKIQYGRIAFYWAVLAFVLAIAWSVLLGTIGVRGAVPALTFGLPIVGAFALSVPLYFKRDHQTMEYDKDGYTILKGKRPQASHKWSEFKECSIVRDSYEKIKVRLYTDRDTQYSDVDSASSGIDPFRLRDFILETAAGFPRGEVSNVAVLRGLEMEIHRGRANWVADLNETFRAYQVSGASFGLMARGSTRPKGFLLSRMLAVTVMPDYRVAFYANEIKDPTMARSEFRHLVRIVEAIKDQKDVKWSWLLFLSEKTPESIVRVIEEFGNKDLGVGFLETSTGSLITSQNQLGKSLSKQMRLHRLVKDLNKRIERHRRSNSSSSEPGGG